MVARLINSSTKRSTLTVLDDWSTIQIMNRTKTREQLLRVGSEIIAQQGFNMAGINAVLSRAGVPKGSFYIFQQ